MDYAIGLKHPETAYARKVDPLQQYPHSGSGDFDVGIKFGADINQVHSDENGLDSRLKEVDYASFKDDTADCTISL